MKKLLTLAVALCAYSAMASSWDHGKLKTLSAQVTNDSYQLYVGAYQVIGSFPTYRQRYAYEHIQFLYNSAHRFQQAAQGITWDHAADRVRQAYQKLDHDTLHARQTFNDLFGSWDHGQYDRLNRLLLSVEGAVSELRFHLP